MDLRCFDDLDLFGEETANPLEELEQDLYHRLITPPGRNPDDPDGGIGLLDLLSGDYDISIPSRIEAEIRKDTRVLAVAVLVTEVANGQYRVQIDVQADEGVLGMTLEAGPDGVVRI